MASGPFDSINQRKEWPTSDCASMDLEQSRIQPEQTPRQKRVRFEQALSVARVL
jgi:hypothetical protein